MPEPIVTLNEESLRSDLRELVGRTVEDTLNGLLEAEADELVGAERYERTADREAYRAGHYDCGLTTSSGEVTIHMPKLKGACFTTAIIERYRRRESSVDEAMMEMYLAGVSTRRIGDASEILWGSSVSAATVSNLNERAFASVEERRNRPLERAYPYVYVDGIYLKRAGAGPTRTSPSWSPSGSTTTATARSSAPPKASRSRRSAGGTSCPGCGPAGSAACGWSSGTRRPAWTGRSRKCSPRRPTGAARDGVARGGRGQGTRGRGGARADAPRGGRQGRKGRIRRDLGVHGLPARALAPHPHQQRHRAAEPRDPQADARGGRLSRREVGPHARHREAQVRRGGRMGIEALPGRDAARRVAVPDGGPMGLSESAQES